MAAPSATMPRPYLNHPIDELERCFASHHGDRAVLVQLQNELRHRSTQRAKRLRANVDKRLAQLGLATPPGAGASPKPTPSRGTGKQQPGESALGEPSPSSTASGPPIDFGKAPSPNQPIKNDPSGLLSAWTAIEVLNPPTFNRPADLAGGDRTRVSSLGEGDLPWERGEKSRPKFQLYYQIVLGTLKMLPPVESLLRRYGDSRPEAPSVRGSAVLAAVVTDRKGRLVESPAVAVSSFPWGVMRALKGDLADLSTWLHVQQDLVRRVEARLLGIPREGTQADLARDTPLTWNAIMDAFHMLMKELQLPEEWVEPPCFAIRSYCYFKDHNPPEPLLLNSFFLEDLATASELLRQGRLPETLQSYLGMRLPIARFDLRKDAQALERAISPAVTPVSRWPSKGRHPLVLLQQAAVNQAFEQLKGGGLLGVNGPPGTGKTTLLRDIVAGVVASRAEAMCRFDDPEAAFTNSGQRLKVGDGGWIHLYSLDSALHGFEMIVASSNNKAVENVSAELPGLDAIADDATELRYFQTLSDALSNGETWGVIAAVLGNSQNRSRFKQTFWWDDDLGLGAYLRAAAGLPVLKEDTSNRRKAGGRETVGLGESMVTGNGTEQDRNAGTQ